MDDEKKKARKYDLKEFIRNILEVIGSILSWFK